MVSVTKFDGSKQRYMRDKVLNTSMRLGASREQAREIADEVERQLYSGMPTREILGIIRRWLRERRPRLDLRTDLRSSISMLRPKPDFERFVRLLLHEYGYRVTPNRIVRGLCVEHEIDGIAEKDGMVFYLEVKHHSNPHTYTGLDIMKEARATFEDLVEGEESGRNDIAFSDVLVVCNTKFSDHARRYAECRGIGHMGWKAPVAGGLEVRIEEKELYPITMYRDLDRKSLETLGDLGMVLLKQLLMVDRERLIRRSGLSPSELRELSEFAIELLTERSDQGV